MIPPYITAAAGPPESHDFAGPPPEMEVAFFLILGQTLARWQFVEGFLYSMFVEAIGVGRNRALAASFHQIATFRGRLDSTNAAMQEALSGFPVLLSEWNLLYKRFGSMAKLRNKWIHSVVWFQADQNKMFLAPTPLDPKRFSGQFKQNEVVTEAMLLQAQAEYDAVRVDLLRFQTALLARIHTTSD